MTQQKLISHYLKQVKKSCPFSFRKVLIKELKNHLFDYLNANPCNTLEDIINHFGSPEKFADEYLLAMDETARKKIIQTTKCFKWSCLLATTAIIFTIMVVAFKILCEISETRVYYYYEYVTEDNIKHD